MVAIKNVCFLMGFSLLLCFKPISTDKTDFRQLMPLTITAKRTSAGFAALLNLDIKNLQAEKLPFENWDETIALSTEDLVESDDLQWENPSPAVELPPIFISLRETEGRSESPQWTSSRGEPPTRVTAVDQMGRRNSKYDFSHLANRLPPTLTAQELSAIVEDIDLTPTLSQHVNTVIKHNRLSPINTAPLPNRNELNEKRKANQLQEEPLVPHDLAYNEPEPIGPSLNFPEDQSEGGNTNIISAATAGTVLKGHIEVTEGLAFTGADTKIKVLHFDDESNLAIEGKVNLEKGLYEIAVNGFSGTLMAQMIGTNGETVGKAEVRLDPKSLKAKTDSGMVSGPNLLITPFLIGLQGRVESAYSSGHSRIPVKGAEVQINGIAREPTVDSQGHFADSDIMRDSSFLIRSASQGFWPSLKMGIGGIVSDVLLFPNKMVDALLSLLNYGGPKEHLALIWGRVLGQDGKPVAGARVEVAGETFYQVVYFNKILIPWLSQTETSTEGWFVAIGFASPIVGLKATKEGQTSSVEVVPGEEGHVSFVEIHLGDEQSASLKMLEAFSHQPIDEVEIREFGDDRVTTLSTSVRQRSTLSYRAKKSPLFLEVDAGERYPFCRVTASPQSAALFFRIPTNEWLTAIERRYKINRAADSGIVVGFVEDSRFQVTLGSRLEDQGERIIYFDGQGEVLKQEPNTARRGYIIFDVPKGLQTVSLMAIGSNHIDTQVVVSDPAAVSVINHRW